MITSLYRNPDGHLKQNLTDDELRAAVRSGVGLLWVDFHKPTADEVFQLDDVFGFHALAIEDCQHVSQYPKLDNFGNYLFIVFMAPNPQFKPNATLDQNGVSDDPVLEVDLFCGRNYVVTFHSTSLPFIQVLMENAKRDSKRVLGREAVFLLHNIIDAAVDQFFAMMNTLQGEAEEAEARLQQRGQKEVLSGVLELKCRILRLRRQMSDHRELLQRLLRSNHPVVVPESHIYFRDIVDHLNRIENDLDACREAIGNACEVYLEMAQVRTNDVIQVLTVVFTLSLPFSILTSWYGMNFQYLPLMDHPAGAWIATGIMTLFSLTMFFWLRTKRWF
ncbi:MAG: magnesium transporter CorA family protein [Planctomycetota bacterium]